MMEWIQSSQELSGGLITERLLEGAAAASLLATKDCLFSHFQLFAEVLSALS